MYRDRALITCTCKLLVFARGYISCFAEESGRAGETHTEALLSTKAGIPRYPTPVIVYRIDGER